MEENDDDGSKGETQNLRRMQMKLLMQTAMEVILGLS